MLLSFWSPLNPVAKMTRSDSIGLASPSMIKPSLQKLTVFDFFIKMDLSFSLSKYKSGSTPNVHLYMS